MPDISLTRNTELRGRALQDAVASMIQDLSGQSPYNMVDFGWRWVNGAQIALDAPRHMSGTVAIRDGNPSTVSVQMNLISGLAQGQRSRVIRDMNAQADRFLAGTAPSQPSTSTEAPREESWLERRRRERAEREAAEAAQPQEESWLERRRRERAEREAREGVLIPGTEPRTEFNWGLFGQVFQNLTSGVSGGLNAMNEAYAQTTAEQALAVATDEAGKQSFDGGVLYTKPIDVTQQQQQQPGDAPPPVMADPRGMPTWGWWALGIGGAAAVGLTIWLVRRGRD